MEKVSIFCFAASYITALALHLVNQFKPMRCFHILAIGFGTAGFFAQSLFLAYWQPPLATQFGWFLLSSWLLTAFYIYATLHYRHITWWIFVLPLIIGLVISATLFSFPTDAMGNKLNGLVVNTRIFGWLHVFFLLSATLAICLGSLSSIMYLIQSLQIRNKLAPGTGLQLSNLEKLENGIRYCIAVGFPLLSLGLLIGIILLFQIAEKIQGWMDPRILSSIILWMAFAVLVYARYGLHLRGKQLAWLTITSFLLLLICLALPHQVPMGVGK